MKQIFTVEALTYRMPNYQSLSTALLKEGKTVAFFVEPSDAQKVCDLLNESSRSQGKYPKEVCNCTDPNSIEACPIHGAERVK